MSSAKFPSPDGAGAAIFSDALMNLFDVILERMQVHGSIYTSVVDSATKGDGVFLCEILTTIDDLCSSLGMSLFRDNRN
ncbi:MAG: hypothetical protein BYD32DRAFT_457781 [Podila humilis]|nr:MAG: hypothetical protein BYD32DRAFT_457781 [Podila humilis]